MRNENGSTLVEVIVAFSVLVFAFGILFQAMVLTERMMRRSHELRKEDRELAGYYYLEGDSDGLISEEGKSMDEWPAVLKFHPEDSRKIVLEIPVTIREFKGKHGSLYDAVTEKAEADEIYEE